MAEYQSEVNQSGGRATVHNHGSRGPNCYCQDGYYTVPRGTIERSNLSRAKLDSNPRVIGARNSLSASYLE